MAYVARYRLAMALGAVAADLVLLIAVVCAVQRRLIYFPLPEKLARAGPLPVLARHRADDARVSDAHTGERLPAFSVQLDPPPNGDRQLAATLARLSAERYGRDALDVDLDLQGALERIRGPRRTADTEGTDAPTGPPEPAAPDIGTPASAAVVAGAEVPK